MKTKKKNSVVQTEGSTFDSFLEEEGIREVESVAAKRVIAWQACGRHAEKEENKASPHQRAAHQPFSEGVKRTV